MLENKFQANLIKELKERFPGCIVMKNDPTYIQGIPDLLVLHKDKWASLECKKSAGAKKQPNQEYYVDRMSDADLKKRIERLKLEREFKNLTEDDITPGRKYVSEILSASGKKALTVAAAGAMTYAVKTAMTKEFNLKEAAQYIAANPNKKK